MSQSYNFLANRNEGKLEKEKGCSTCRSKQGEKSHKGKARVQFFFCGESQQKYGSEEALLSVFSLTAKRNDAQ